MSADPALSPTHAALHFVWVLLLPDPVDKHITFRFVSNVVGFVKYGGHTHCIAIGGGVLPDSILYNYRLKFLQLKVSKSWLRV